MQSEKPGAKPAMMAPEAIDFRLLQEEGKCARDYDAARRELATTHGQAEEEEAGAKAELAKLLPDLRALLDEEGKGDYGAWAKAQPILARLEDARSAKRAAYTGAVPPAEQALGEPLGTPAYNDANELPAKAYGA